MTRGKARFIYLQLQLHCNLSRVRRLPQGSLLHEPVTQPTSGNSALALTQNEMSELGLYVFLKRDQN